MSRYLEDKKRRDEERQNDPFYQQIKSDFARRDAYLDQRDKYDHRAAVTEQKNAATREKELSNFTATYLTEKARSSALDRLLDDMRKASAVTNAGKHYDILDATKKSLYPYTDIGWGADYRQESARSADNAAKRMARYESNQKRIAEIDEQLKGQTDSPIVKVDGGYKLEFVKQPGHETEYDKLKAERSKLQEENDYYHGSDGQYVSDLFRRGVYNQKKDDAKRGIDVNGLSQLQEGDYEKYYNNSAFIRWLMARDPEHEGTNEDFRDWQDEWALTDAFGDKYSHLEYLTEEEVGDLIYLLHKDPENGPAEVDQILQDMKTTLDYRANIEAKETMESAPAWAKAIGNVVSIPASVAMAPLSVLGNPKNPYDASKVGLNFVQNLRHTTAEDIDKATNNFQLAGISLGDVYQAGMSTADSFLGAVTTGGAYTVLMGMSAAGSEMQRLAREDAPTWKVVGGGLASGTIEWLTEKYSFESFLSKFMSGKTTELFSKETLKNILLQGASEASEEVMSELGNALSDVVFNGDRAEIFRSMYERIAEGESKEKAFAMAIGEKAVDAWQAAVGGFISGGAMGTGGAILDSSKTPSYSQIGNEIIDNDSANLMRSLAKDLASERLGLDEKGQKAVAKAAANYDAKGNVRSLGRLTETVGNEIRRASADTIDNAINKAGLTGSDADTAKTIFNILSENPNFELSEEDQAFVQRPDVWNAYNELFGSTAYNDEISRYTNEGWNTLKGTVRYDGMTEAQSKVAEREARYDYATANKSVRTTIPGVGKNGQEVIEQAKEKNANLEAVVSAYNQGVKGTEMTGEVDLIEKQAYIAGKLDAITEKANVERYGKAVVNDNPGLDRESLKKANVKYTSQEVRRLNGLGKAVGAKIEIVDNLADSKGNPVNAEYDAKTATIRISSKSKSPVTAALAHEVVHRIRDVSKDAYNSLARFVLNNMSEEKRASALGVRSIAYGTRDADYVTEEAVADAFGDILESDPSAIDELVKDDRKLGERIRDIIRDIITKIDRYLAQKRDVKRMTPEQRKRYEADRKATEEEFSELRAKLVQAESRFSSALNEAVYSLDAQKNLEDAGINEERRSATVQRNESKIAEETKETVKATNTKKHANKRGNDRYGLDYALEKAKKAKKEASVAATYAGVDNILWTAPENVDEGWRAHYYGKGSPIYAALHLYDALHQVESGEKFYSALTDYESPSYDVLYKAYQKANELVMQRESPVSPMAAATLLAETYENGGVKAVEDLIRKSDGNFTDAALNKAYSIDMQKNLEDAGMGVDEETDTFYSVRFEPGMRGVKSREEIAAMIAEQLVKDGVEEKAAKEQADQFLKDVNGVANQILGAPEYLDFSPDDRYSAVKTNSDYPQGTIDLSNNCPKREGTTIMFDMLQRLYPDRMFTADDIVEMKKILESHGMVTACDACFVEDRRQKLGEIAGIFIDMWKDAQGGKTLQKTNAKGEKVTMRVTKRIAKQYGFSQGTLYDTSDSYVPNQYDLVTYEGFRALQENHPWIAAAFEAYNNSRGQQSGRFIEGHAEYKREILNWSPNKIAKVNNAGGLRIFSFSDFQPVHMLDIIQVITDCAAKGVKIQGYTKNPLFARIVRNTGMKLNRSLIPLGENGMKTVKGKKVLAYDTKGGIDVNSKDFLDERDNPNVGNILIGINPEQIALAFEDDFVDYIIPFHTNKAKAILQSLGIGKWVNYKMTQTEKKLNGETVKDVNIYTQVIDKYHPSNKVEFVNSFLEECRKQKKIPRYAEFLNKEYTPDGVYSDEGGKFNYTYREGYHKLLIDFKMFDSNGNILLQGKVRPDFVTDQMSRVLKEEIKTRKNYRFPQEVFDEVKEHFEGKKYSRSISPEDSARYLELAKDPEKNEAELSRMVEEAARNAGYDSPKLYHGTNAFGFTTIDSNAPGADGFSFWAANKPDVSATYTRYGNARKITQEITDEERDAYIEEAEERLDDSISDFRRAIDQTFSEWYFGQQDNSYLREQVLNANHEMGEGDGVYDVLTDIVGDAWGKYGDTSQEFYEWQETSEWEEIERAIIGVENEFNNYWEAQNEELVGGIYELYANTDNMFVVDGKGETWDNLRPKEMPKRTTQWSSDAPYNTRDVAKWAREQGYDGVIFKNIKDNGRYGRTPAGDVYAFFNPTAQVKSADPVTYDADGNVIPLEERFNPENEDIRYSRDLSEARGNGYDGYSMSNNARMAYESGEKPISKWTKSEIMDAVKELNENAAKYIEKVNLKTLKDNLLVKTSWHHTSSMYNKTDFYSINEDAVENLTEDQVKKWATRAESKATGREFRGDIHYLEWGGTRKHPKATQKVLNDVNIEERGSFYIVTDDNGNELLRKKIGSNGTRVTDYEAEERKERERQAAKEARIAKVRENSSEEAAKFYEELEEKGFSTSMSGNIYPSGRKPTSSDVARGLENFFEKGERRLAPDGEGYKVETWNGTEWESNKYSRDVSGNLSKLIEQYGRIPEGEKPFRDIAVPERTERGKKVARTVRTVLEAEVTPETMVPTIQQLIEDGAYSYDVYTDEQALKNAEADIKKAGFTDALTRWTKNVAKGKVNKTITAEGWALYNAAATAGDAEAALTVLRNIVGNVRSAAQALQAVRILKKMSPEVQLYNVVKTVEQLIRDAKERYGNDLDIQVDSDLAEDFLNARSDEERKKILQKIYKEIGRQLPTRWTDRWNAWRYLAMLGNPRTHIRNIAGNAGFMPVVMTKNAIATGIESAVDFVTRGKLNRTKGNLVGKRGAALLKAAATDYANVKEEALGERKYSDAELPMKEIEDNRRVFGNTRFKAWNKTGGRALEWARVKNTELLDKEDVWFSKPHYAFAMAQYCKANGITAEQIASGKGLDKARQYAIKEAQKATYRDTNAFSQMVSRIGRRSPNDNVFQKVGKGLIEGILPFRKTPANILARGVEYSPIGLLKAISADAVSVAKGKMTGAEMIDHLSAGLTGTGLVALGMWLASMGIVKGHGGDDDKDDAFGTLRGHQQYSLELGNLSITLDWLAPESLPFFIGVNLYEEAADKRQGGFEDLLTAIGNTSEPFIEMSCLQSLNDLLDSVGYAKNKGFAALPSTLISAASSYVSQGLPTIFGQAERAFVENKRMTTYADGKGAVRDLQYNLGKAANKIPIWDYNQIPYIDAWGREETTGNFATRLFNNFVNPSYVKTVSSDKIEDELMRVYESTGKSAVFPKRANRTIKANNVEYDLNAQDYVKYATVKGGTAYEVVGMMTQNSIYKDMTDADKASALQDAYTYSDWAGRSTVGVPLSAADSWIGKAVEANRRGITPDVYILARNATNDFESLKDKNGKAIDNSPGLLTMQYIYKISGLTNAQRRYLFESFGVGKKIIGLSQSQVNAELAKMRQK